MGTVEIVLLSTVGYLFVAWQVVRYWLGKWAMEDGSGKVDDDELFMAWCAGFLWPICTPVAGIVRFSERHPDAWRSIWYRIPSDEKKRLKLRAMQKRTTELERELGLNGPSKGF